MQRITIFLILSALFACSAAAAIRVERDGSGDFVNIQDAVDAAANGDTLLIGPGRWDETFTYTTPQGGWTDQVIVATDGKDLSLIGSGQGETIIGPEIAPPFGLSGPHAVVLATDNSLVVQECTIENMKSGLYVLGTAIQVSGVEFRGCDAGCRVYGSGSNIFQNSVFNGCVNYGIAAQSEVSSLIVDNCVFKGGADQYITVRYVENIVVSDCLFRDGIVAVQFDGTSCRGTIERCVVESGRGPHIVAASGSRMQINDCTLNGGLKQVVVRGYSHLSGTGNQFLGTDYGGGGYTTMEVQFSTLDFHGNHILKGDAEFTVQCRGFIQDDPLIVDLRNNYWGTASADTLAAWVWNEDDDPDQNLVTLIEPFSPQPVPEEKTGTGDLKRMFR